jgi:glycerol-3-phosphate O-acyltransferase
LFDTIFGPVDFPGDLRAALQFLLNHKNCVVRVGEPLSLREFLEQEAPAENEGIILRRLTYALLRKVERERRAVLGPVQKPIDRVREEVLRSPRLQAVIRDLAGKPNPEASPEMQIALVTEKARRMLRALQADPNPQTLKGLEVIADTLIDRLYAGVDVDAEGIERVREAARRGSLVLLPSHKSHVDYLLLAYVLRKNALQIPIVAAGDNLSFFPIGPLFRRAGAFFIRRNFKGDRLYAAVVDAYIRRLLRDGFAIEFFLEGGRSRTGKLLPPMLGLLNMVVDAAMSVENRPVSFVPVSIGYERMMEEGVYARELSGAAKRPEDIAALLKVGQVLREKYGRANVQFGEIIELHDLGQRPGPAGETVTPAKRRALVTRLAHRVMSEINRVTAVTPGSLVAIALLCHGRRGISHKELVAQCARLTRAVVHLGARTAPSLTRAMEPATGRSGAGVSEQAIRDAALLYVRAGLVRQHVPGDTLTGTARGKAKVYAGDDVIYSVSHDKRLLLDFSKNIIIDLFIDRALISVALFAGEGGTLAGIPKLRERVQALSRLFKFEFMFRADAPFDQIFDETLADMTAAGELVVGGDAVSPGHGHDGLGGTGWVALYASMVRNFIEGYRIAARTLRVLSAGPLADKELALQALRVGEQMFLGGEIERSEAVSRHVLENAFAAFLDQRYLERAGGKLALSEPFRSDDAIQSIETTVASYLRRMPGDLGWL